MLVNIQGSRVCCRILTGGQQAPRALDNYNKHTLYQTLERFWETIKWNGKFLYATFLRGHYFSCPLNALSAWSGPTRKFILIKTEVMNGHFMAHVFRASTRGTGSGGTARKSRLITQVMTRMGRALFGLSHRVRSGNEVPRL